MKKTIPFFAGMWALLLALYNVVVFGIRALPGYEIEYDSRFWISWALVIAAYLGVLVCGLVALNAKNAGKLFLKLPPVTQSFGAVIALTAISSLCMLIPDCPAWVAAVFGGIVLVYNAIAVLKAAVVGQIVNKSEEKIKNQTFFIKFLAVDAETLMARAQNEEIKAECRKVYEAIRYSDPMSNNALSAAESQITLKFAALSDAVAAGNRQAVEAAAREVIILLKDRNKKCQLLK